MNPSVHFNLDHAMRLSYGVMQVDQQNASSPPDAEAMPTDSIAVVIPLTEQLEARSELWAYVQDGVLYWLDTDRRHIFQLGEVGNPLPKAVLDQVVGDGLLVLYEDVQRAQVIEWGVMWASMPSSQEAELLQRLLGLYEQTNEYILQHADSLSPQIKQSYVLALENVKAAAKDLKAQQQNTALTAEQRSIGVKAAAQKLYLIQSLNGRYFQ